MEDANSWSAGKRRVVITQNWKETGKKLYVAHTADSFAIETFTAFTHTLHCTVISEWYRNKLALPSPRQSNKQQGPAKWSQV